MLGRKSGAWVFFLALATRLAFDLSRGPELMRPLEDQRLYLRMGRAVAEGRGLTLDPREYHPLEGGEWKRQIPQHWVDPYDPGMGVAREGKPTAVIEPLYPLVLGLLNLLHAGGIMSIRILQGILGSLTALLLFAIGSTVNARTGLLAGIGFAVFPHAVYYTGMITTETLFITLQALAFLAWIRMVRVPTSGRGLLFGVAAGCAFLVRSAILPISLLAATVGVAARRRTVRAVPLALLGFVLATAPWVIRNGLSMGDYRLMPTKDGLNLWMQNHPGIQQLQLERIGTPIPAPLIESLACRELETFPDFSDSVPEVQRNRVLTARARQYIRCNPRYFLHLCWLRLRWYLRFTGSTVRSGIADTVGATWFGWLLILACAGVARGWRSPAVSLSVLAWLGYLAMHAVFHGGIRYRIPADSLLIVAAAYGLDRALERCTRARR